MEDCRISRLLAHTLPVKQESLEDFPTIFIADGFQRTASAKCGNLLVYPILDVCIDQVIEYD